VDTSRASRGSFERRRRQQRRRLLLRWLALVACAAVVVLVVLLVVRGCGDGATGTAGTTSTGGTGSTAANESTTSTEKESSPSSSNPPTTVAVGEPDQPGDERIPGTFYGPINTKFAGLTMFRGNASRTYYGEGPVPKSPSVLWKFGPMSGQSTDFGTTSTWSGTGWTGQPCVFERNGKTWVVFGAYDWKIHFLDAETGERLLPDFKGGDIFKGSAVVDPDGYPLIFMGCRDNKWRIIAIDRDKPTELFNLDSDILPNPIWNDDWDSSVVIRNDYAFVGGENGHFYILKLNRGYNSAGKVIVDPQIVLDYPAWTQALLDKIGSRDVSVENSPCLVGDRVYFSNGGGLVQGLDVSATLKELKPGEAPATGKAAYPKVFHFWTGDDTDATIVADEEGYLYVCQHSDSRRGFSERAKEIGQIIKLDPRKNGTNENPVVWSQNITKLYNGNYGVWATATLYKDMVYVPTNGGALLGLDRKTGEIVWRKTVTEHAWASCSVVDQTLIMGDYHGVLHAWDVSDTRVDPPVIWEYAAPSKGAFVATAAVWKGKIFQGSYDGYLYCLGDK